MAEAIDPLDLDAIEQAKEKSDEFDRLKRLIEIGDLKWLMAHRQGRRIVRRLLEKYGVYRSVFRVVAAEMAFLEGQRNCGLALIADLLEHTPERYAEMIQETKDDNDRISKRSNSST